MSTTGQAIGSTITFKDGEDTLTGVVRGHNPDGSLLVSPSDDASYTVTVRSGEIVRGAERPNTGVAKPSVKTPGRGR